MDDKYEQMADRHLRGFREDLQKIIDLIASMLGFPGCRKRTDENLNILSTRVYNFAADMFSSLKMAWRTCYAVQAEEERLRESFRQEQQAKRLALLEISKLQGEIEDWKKTQSGPNSDAERLRRQAQTIADLQKEVEALRSDLWTAGVEKGNLKVVLSTKEDNHRSAVCLLKEEIEALKNKRIAQNNEIYSLQNLLQIKDDRLRQGENLLKEKISFMRAKMAEAEDLLDEAIKKADSVRSENY